MVTVWHLSQQSFLFFVFALPFLAIACGLLQKRRWFFVGAGLEFALLVASLFSMDFLLRHGRFPGATGMEGLAFVIQPAAFLVSVLVGVLLYALAAWFARLP